jgi:TRAP-type C4-dicarboxylate transport system substrate-binding protein
MVPTTCVTQELIMNKKTWNSFPPDIQKAIMSVSGENAAIRLGGKCFDGAWDMVNKGVEESGSEMIKYTPPKEEVDRWVNAAGKSIWEKWIKKMEKQGHKNAREIHEEALRMVKEYSKGKTDMWRDMFK